MTTGIPSEARRPGLLKSLLAASERLEGEMRRTRPARFHGPSEDVLTVDEVAAILRCSVDQARRIPRTELPAYQGPGKYVLFFREDVLRYLRGRQPKHETRAYGAVLKAPRGQRSNHAAENVHAFDPGAVLARLRKQDE